MPDGSPDLQAPLLAKQAQDAQLKVELEASRVAEATDQLQRSEANCDNLCASLEAAGAQDAPETRRGVAKSSCGR